MLLAIRSSAQICRNVFRISMKVGSCSLRDRLRSRSYSEVAAKVGSVCSRLRMK